MGRANGGGRRRALVVDDNEHIRAMVAAMLSAAPLDFEADTAADAEAAARLLATERYDLVVTDLELPGASGLSVAERASPVPVLFMTGGAAASLIEEARKRAAGPVLAKPFTSDDLTRRVAELVGEG